MKILVIFTGGTIGSAEMGGVIKPDGSSNFRLIEGYKKRAADYTTQFDTCAPLSFLSENLSCDRLNIILDTIAEKIKEDYDGIILTHGTDTIAYTAAACGFAFADRGKSIAIVSSDYPLDDERANGFDNFAAAVKIINEKKKGVFVCYKNTDKKETDIHLATRLIQYPEASDNLYSLSGRESIAVKAYPKGRYTENREILVIDAIPYNRYPTELCGVKAIIIRPYHSATVNSEDKDLAALLMKAKGEGIPEFLVNSRESKEYESKEIFEKAGITVLPKCAFASIYMKCWLATSMGYDIEEFVKNEIYGEFC